MTFRTLAVELWLWLLRWFLLWLLRWRFKRRGKRESERKREKDGRIDITIAAIMAERIHLFPFRTQKLSLLVPKIVSWKRLVKIGSRRLLYGPLVKRLRQRPLTPLTSVRFRYGSPYAPLAQLVEQLTLNQWAQGSSPWRCTRKATQ